MRILVNRKAVRGPWGGENSFMGALCGWLESQGHSIVTDPDDRADIALLNALTLIDLDHVRRIADRGIPIVHRKTGFTCRGSDELRAVTNGIVEGDRRQIAFGPYVGCSVFQSRYSRDLFVQQGFQGPHVIIHNGVDEAKFGQVETRLFGLRKARRRFWTPGTPIKVLTVSWSPDASKGFDDLVAIDRGLDAGRDVEYRFVGRLADGVRFRNIAMLPPQSHRRLARTYRCHHVLVFLGRHESCSNTILEAINCGLPIIYHPSGANPETAGPYGVPFEGDFAAALDAIRRDYDRLTRSTADNPYRISLVGPRYLDVLEKVLAGDVLGIPSGGGRGDSPVQVG